MRRCAWRSACRARSIDESGICVSIAGEELLEKGAQIDDLNHPAATRVVLCFGVAVESTQFAGERRVVVQTIEAQFFSLQFARYSSECGRRSMGSPADL